MRIFLLARHGQSLFNVDGVVNGDPLLDRGLSEQGIVEAGRLGGQIDPIGLDLLVVSPFPRAVQTANIALGERRIPHEVEPELADVRLGLLERAERVTLVVCHEVPVRYAVNAANGSDELDGPLHDVANASPYVFDEEALGRAVGRMRELAAG